MKKKFILLVLPFIATAGSAFGQSEKVLSGKEITESALVEALTPAPDSAPASALTRSIRVNRENAPTITTPASPAKTASASLLITFQTNSAQLTPRARQSLDVVGQALNSEKLSDYRFAVQGHADPRGAPEANLRLSQLRAEAVRQYLVRNKHIADKRLEAVGKGDSELLNPANPSAPENRRVTIVNLSQ
jgi:outer membrane protein OmpA-like peptidoglycan-associated protein